MDDGEDAVLNKLSRVTIGLLISLKMSTVTDSQDIGKNHTISLIPLIRKTFFWSNTQGLI